MASEITPVEEIATGERAVEASSSSPAPPPILWDSETGRRRVGYRIIEPIGTFFLNDRFPVYRAAVITEETSTREDNLVAVKCLSLSHNEDECSELTAEVTRNRNVLTRYDNLMIVQASFHYQGFLCVVFPYMNMGSIRRMMKTRFPDGMPEHWILVVLKEALKGLAEVHRYYMFHDFVHLGNIFLNFRVPEIKLSFAATMYTTKEDEQEQEQEEEQNQDLYMPVRTICTWAASPEVYNGTREIYNNPEANKADVWMIGIVALELACGGLHIKDRKTLDRLVKKMQKAGRIPREGGRMTMKEKIKKVVSRVLRLRGSGRQPVQSKIAYSEEFHEMVLSCLEPQVEERPITDQVLQRRIFRRLGSTPEDLYMFLCTV